MIRLSMTRDGYVVDYSLIESPRRRSNSAYRTGATIVARATPENHSVTLLTCDSSLVVDDSDRFI